MQNFNTTKNTIIYSFFYFFLSLLLSAILYIMKIVKPDGNLNKTYLYIGIIIGIIFLLNFFKQLIMYDKSKHQIRILFLEFIYYILLILFPFVLMSLKNNDIKIIISEFILLIPFWIFISNEKKTTNKKEHSERADLPVDSFDVLFPTRQKDFKRIYDFIKDIDTSEPYALAISASWGEGKSSLINVLINKLKEDNSVVK